MTDFSQKPRSVSSNRIGSIDQMRSISTSIVLLGGESPARVLRVGEHGGELAGVQMALVEELLGGLDDRRHDSRAAHDAAGRADRAVAGAGRDVADLERELRRPGERVAPLVHGGRACVGRLAAPRDAVPLDAEGSQYDPERQAERLEDGALLDVQLEVGGRRVELAPRLERSVEVDPVLGERVRERDAVPVRELAELVLVGHRPGRCARAEQAAAEARALLVGPVDEAQGDRRRSVFRDAAQDLDPGDDVQRAVEPAAVRHGVDVAADEHRALGLPGEREPLVAGLVDLLRRARPGDLLAKPRAGRLPGLRPGDPLRSVLVPGELAELLQLGDRAARLERHEREPSGARIGLHGRLACDRFRRCGARSILKRAAVFVLVLGGIWALWEGYRWLWLETGWTKPFTVNQYTLPHLHDIVLQLGEPTSTGDDLWLYLFHAALFTARAAAVGFLFGAAIGFALGVVLAQFDVLRRGIMPYVVASQTIPILALAPIVVRRAREA